MKKIIVLLLCLSMCIALFGACGNTPDESPSPSAENTTSPSTSPSDDAQSPSNENSDDENVELEPFKIGMLFAADTDPVTNMRRQQCATIAEAAGGEMVWETWNFSPDTLVSGLENLHAAGCNAVFFIPTAEFVLPAVASYCEEVGMYWAVCGKAVHDPDVLAAITASPYYLGGTVEQLEPSAELAIQKLVDDGCKNIAMLMESETDDSYNQYLTAAETVASRNDGVQIVTVIPGNTETEIVTQSTESILASYPETDGIVLGTGLHGGNYEAFISTLERLNRRDVKYVSCDSNENAADDLDSGLCSAMYGDTMTASMLYDMALLINAVQGTPLYDGAVELPVNCLEFATGDSLRAYDELFLNSGKAPYSEKACQEYLFAFWPGSTVTGDSVKAELENWSVARVEEVIDY